MIKVLVWSSLSFLHKRQFIFCLSLVIVILIVPSLLLIDKQVVRGEVSHVHNSKLNISQIISGNGTLQICGLTESGRNETTATTTNASTSLLFKANQTYYVFSKDRSEISTPENNSHTGEFGSGVRIALVEPTFTAAAYNDVFYRFFNLYSNTSPGTNVTSNLKLLTSKVQDQNFTTASTATATATGSSAFAMLKLIANCSIRA